MGCSSNFILIFAASNIRFYSCIFSHRAFRMAFGTACLCYTISAHFVFRLILEISPVVYAPFNLSRIVVVCPRWRSVCVLSTTLVSVLVFLLFPIGPAFAVSFCALLLNHCFVVLRLGLHLFLFRGSFLVILVPPAWLFHPVTFSVLY